MVCCIYVGLTPYARLCRTFGACKQWAVAQRNLKSFISVFSYTLVHELPQMLELLLDKPCITAISIHGCTRLYTVLGHFVFFNGAKCGCFMCDSCHFGEKGRHETLIHTGTAACQVWGMLRRNVVVAHWSWLALNLVEIYINLAEIYINLAEIYSAKTTLVN